MGFGLGKTPLVTVALWQAHISREAECIWCSLCSFVVMEAYVGERKVAITRLLSLSIQLIPMWLPMIQSNTKVSHPLGCPKALFPPENLRASIRGHLCSLDYKEGTMLAYSWLHRLIMRETVGGKGPIEGTDRNPGLTAHC